MTLIALESAAFLYILMYHVKNISRISHILTNLNHEEIHLIKDITRLLLKQIIPHNIKETFSVFENDIFVANPF
jgi:hypothetical protein